ncbi:uncharacterized protein LOC113213387 [Frankliniella occidentalis]|uniref:Uncharacterized protein LOC113213387 n=1 Tax=Frankliniella occidentalis TaxID=133901 RepID=A0A6J1TA81_FRAOC|nr:uncharacterized protein LOC113213387 [Frankliniella occidentalis]
MSNKKQKHRVKAQQQKEESVKKSSSGGMSRRSYHFKNGSRALKEIKFLQRTTNLLIPKASFCRLVKEIINEMSHNQFRIQSLALSALQEAVEMYIVQFFEDSLLCSLHAKRVTLMVQDCCLMRRLRGPNEICNR